MISRRQFIKTSALAAGAVASSGILLKARPAYAVNNSDQLAKWIQGLRGLTALGDPNGIPVLNGVPDPVFANTTLYQVTAGEFTGSASSGAGHPPGFGATGTPPTR